jgi:hypothetical protein
VHSVTSDADDRFYYEQTLCGARWHLALELSENGVVCRGVTAPQRAGSRLNEKGPRNLMP